MNFSMYVILPAALGPLVYSAYIVSGEWSAAGALGYHFTAICESIV
jgi:hypothetical protein